MLWFPLKRAQAHETNNKHNTHMKTYYDNSPYASIEVHSTPQLINWTEFGEDLPQEGIVHEAEGRFVVYNHVTGTRRPFTSWDDAAGRRAEMAQRYATLERAFR